MHNEILCYLKSIGYSSFNEEIYKLEDKEFTIINNIFTYRGCNYYEYIYDYFIKNITLKEYYFSYRNLKVKVESFI